MSRELFETAYRRYWDHAEAIPIPRFAQHTHDLCDQIASVRWYGSGEAMVRSELQEVVNLLNEWRTRLFRWGVWVDVLDEYGDEDAWAIRDHFVEQIAFYCMFQPTLPVIALRASPRTRYIRQILRLIAHIWIDLTQTIRVSVAKDRARISRRSLLALVLVGPRQLDFETRCGEWTRKNTDRRPPTGVIERVTLWRHDSRKDYVRMVERTIVPLTRSTEQADGTFRLEEVPGKSAVSYGWGGSPPMPLRETHLANLEQYEGMVQAHKAYEELILEFLRVLPKADGARAQ